MLLKLKADKEDTESLRISTVTKEEFQIAESSITDLKNQLDNALVLFIECVKNNVLLYSEGKNKLVNKNASILHQLNCIYKWINNYDGHDKGLIFSEKQEGYNFNTVLPDTATKLFGSRRASHNMRKLNVPSCNTSVNQGKESHKN